MIAIVIGTNAELIKTFPVMQELERRGIVYTFVHTGQHDLEKTCKLFGIKSPDITLTKPPELSSKFFTRTTKAIAWNMFLVPRIRKVLRKIPDLKYVLYHGDTMSTASAAIASSKFLNPRKNYVNIHLEAGLRSGSIWEPFPEEISRKFCDKFSDLLLAVSDGTEENLRREKPKGKIMKIGNTIIDSAEVALEMKPSVEIPKGEFALINTHRHENIKRRSRLEKVVQIIEKIGIEAHWPLHDNTKRRLEKFGLMERLEKMKNLHITRLINYVDFIHMLNSAKYLVTDGGSIQEESLAVRKPCILLRKLTERDEGLKTGINFLTGLNVEKAEELIKRFESDFVVPDFENPYGRPGVSKKIVDYLEQN